MPQPENRSGPSNPSTIFAARSGLAMPVNSSCPAFDVRTRQGVSRHQGRGHRFRFPDTRRPLQTALRAVWLGFRGRSPGVPSLVALRRWQRAASLRRHSLELPRARSALLPDGHRHERWRRANPSNPDWPSPDPLPGNIPSSRRHRHRPARRSIASAASMAGHNSASVASSPVRSA